MPSPLSKPAPSPAPSKPQSEPSRSACGFVLFTPRKPRGLSCPPAEACLPQAGLGEGGPAVRSSKSVGRSFCLPRISYGERSEESAFLFGSGDEARRFIVGLFLCGSCLQARHSLCFISLGRAAAFAAGGFTLFILSLSKGTGWRIPRRPSLGWRRLAYRRQASRGLPASGRDLLFKPGSYRSRAKIAESALRSLHSVQPGGFGR